MAALTSEIYPCCQCQANLQKPPINTSPCKNTQGQQALLPRKDRVTNLLQGYGFVEFHSEEDADYAIKVLPK